MVQYLNASPAQESEFYEVESTIWKKMHAARIKEDLLDGYSLFRVISPTGTKTEYNFVVVLEYETVEKLAGHFESYGVDYTSILSAQEISTAIRTPEIRDLVYEEVWLNLETVFRPNPEKMYRFQVFNAMKLRPGVTADEYQRVESTYWKPVHQKRINDKNMFGWGIYNMIIPGGTEREYSWATVDFYDNFIDIMGDTNGHFNNIHGTKNAAKYMEETIGSRDQLRTEVRELLEYMSDDDIEK